MKDDKTQFAELIKKTVDEFGLDIIKDPDKVNAWLMDLAPGNKAERKLIVQVLQEGVGAKLLDILGKPDAEQQHCIDMCVLLLKNETYLDEDAAESAVLAIAGAIGLEWGFGAPACSKTQTAETAGAYHTVDTAFRIERRKEHIVLVEYYGDSDTPAVPEGTDIIGTGAFACCSSLVTVVIPDSVTVIEEGAFRGCSSLNTIRLPEKLKSIGDHAFWGCSNLKKVILPDSVTKLGDNAFDEKTCVFGAAYSKKQREKKADKVLRINGRLIV
ncbi:MAG: leucine-rich repeat domain-containing protein [Abditibacteriota bacterium]|nr:leucine-rich repeat domain-containing protein [Abditibacteriota bacterium]